MVRLEISETLTFEDISGHWGWAEQPEEASRLRLGTSNLFIEVFSVIICRATPVTLSGFVHLPWDVGQDNY